MDPRAPLGQAEDRLRRCLSLRSSSGTLHPTGRWSQGHSPLCKCRGRASWAARSGTGHCRPSFQGSAHLFPRLPHTPAPRCRERLIPGGSRHPTPSMGGTLIRGRALHRSTPPLPRDSSACTSALPTMGGGSPILPHPNFMNTQDHQHSKRFFNNSKIQG